MAEPFKNLLNPARVKQLAADFSVAWPDFPTKQFTRQATVGLDALELKDRARHIAAALGAALPGDVTRAMRIAISSLGPGLSTTEDFGSDVFRHLPLSTWLHGVGLRDVETALLANYELTKRFTAEFSIRPLIIGAQARTLSALKAWTKDESPHVRRLVSEGSRPRLPWAERLPALQADPTITLPLLEALKDDESEYVRRSVANHLNDHSKDHPAFVLQTAKRWLSGASLERRRLVEHGLRTLVKAGDEAALSLLGASGANLSVRGAITPATLNVGEAVTVEATVKNRGATSTHVVVEAVVHFVRPKGTSTKKFRLARLTLEAGGSQTISRRFLMAHRSIRQLYAGPHQVEVQANGKTVKAGTFQLVV
jgi:3-methyladenine DNA glycosylase AlkC